MSLALLQFVADSHVHLLARFYRRAHGRSGGLRRLAAALVLLFAVVSAPAEARSLAVSRANPDTSIGTQRVRTATGQSLFLVGVNYAGAHDRAWRLWESELFDPAVIDRDFAHARLAGANTIRIFVRDPLQEEVLAGNFGKLDQVVGLARRHGLLLLITLFDYIDEDLSSVAAIDRLIAARYVQDPAVLGYDLKNEPHLSDIARARYLKGVTNPLLSEELVRTLGERLTMEELPEWRGSAEARAVVPAWFTDREAYLMGNVYRAYRQFLADSTTWVAGHGYRVSTLDYMDSADAEVWRPLIDALSRSLAAWLGPQIQAVRGVDPNRPITVGYSDALLAKLQANRALSFQSIHSYPGPTVPALQASQRLFANLRRTFPETPLVLGEFGFATNDLDPDLAAIYEGALVLEALAGGGGGALKWVLNDLSVGANPRENALGIYRTDGSAKPVAVALRALGDYVSTGQRGGGTFSLSSEDGQPRYVFSASDARFVGSPSYVDEGLRITSKQPAQVFLRWDEPGAVHVWATAPATLTVNLGVILGQNVAANSTRVMRWDGQAEKQQPASISGGSIGFAVDPAGAYVIRYVPAAVDGRIQIVWPQGNKDVRSADRANVTAYLFEHDANRTICPRAGLAIRLFVARNTEVEQEVATGAVRTVNAGELRFPAIDFNDVDVSPARDGATRLFFRLAIDGVPTYSNVWSHSADARTYLPQPQQPSAVGATAAQAVDARIQILWPHGDAPVTQATKANITVYLFEQGSTRSVYPGFDKKVRLWKATDAASEEAVADGTKVMRSANGLNVPTWDFNDVDVSAARDPQRKLFFRVTVDGIPYRSNIWSHGADGRTIYPKPEVPAAAPACR